MRYSFEWLQSFFDEALPPPAQLAEEITMRAFEVEGVEKHGADHVISIDVKPNRAHDALSHRGMAKDISAILGLPLKEDPLGKPAGIPAVGAWDDVSISVDDENLCRRYSAAVMREVAVKPSPPWLKERLESIGQKSINNVVDITNYVMFHLGQPLHAFDMDKLSGDPRKAIRVRTAKEGETMIALDGETYKLDPEMLLITDGFSNEPVGIAGVKGGIASEITEGTVNVLIESANFDPVSTRKTSQRLRLRTDASVRFENEISPELTFYGLDMAIDMIEEIAGGKLEGLYDFYPNQPKEREIEVTLDHINGLLGSEITGDEVESIIKRFGFLYMREGDAFTAKPPFERFDLNIPEDLVEEVGRVYGYEKISPITPKREGEVEINKLFYYAERVREVLIREGFSEIYTSSFRAKDEVKLANALASDKGYLRSSLRENLKEALVLNFRNADLLGLDAIKIFEIGTVFPKGGEHVSLALGAIGGKKFDAGAVASEALRKALAEIGAEVSAKPKEGIAEVNFSVLVGNLPEPKSYDISYEKIGEKKYKPYSVYPFVLRDIALFVPSGTDPKGVEGAIAGEGGDLLVKIRLFDTYEKEGKVSYAFRLVFQSAEKTLSDEEVNKVMERVYKAVKKEGWEVR